MRKHKRLYKPNAAWHSCFKPFYWLNCRKVQQFFLYLFTMACIMLSRSHTYFTWNATHTGMGAIGTMVRSCHETCRSESYQRREMQRSVSNGVLRDLRLHPFLTPRPVILYCFYWGTGAMLFDHSNDGLRPETFFRNGSLHAKRRGQTCANACCKRVASGERQGVTHLWQASSAATRA